MANSTARAEARNPSNSSIPVEHLLTDLRRLAANSATCTGVPTTFATGIVLEVRALAAISSMIFEHYSGAAIEPDEVGLARIAADLAEHVCSYFSTLPAHQGAPALILLTGIAGPLAAVLHELCAAHLRASDDLDDEARFKLTNRIAWLQAKSCDLSQDLAEAVSLSKAWGAE